MDVLREACSEWYYEAQAAVAAAVERDDMSRGSRIEGPISTRALSKLYHRNQLPADASHQNISTVVAGTTRVYRNEQEGWKQIDQLDNLLLAMEAFRETAMPPLWSEQRENYDCTNDDQQVSTERNSQNVTEELEAFLSSTDHLAPHAASTNKGNSYDNHDQEQYESDGGTRYIRDWKSGNRIHEAQKVQSSSNHTTNATATAAHAAAHAAAGSKNKKRKKPKFSAKSARNWIYVTGLPLDTTEEELAKYFSKVGFIDIDPESLKPKIKLYRHKTTTLSLSSSTSSSTTTTTTDTINNGGELLGKLKGDAYFSAPKSRNLPNIGRFQSSRLYCSRSAPNTLGSPCLCMIGRWFGEFWPYTRCVVPFSIYFLLKLVAR